MTREKGSGSKLPDIAAMIREATDREGWVAGQLSSDSETEDYLVIEQGMPVLYAHFPGTVVLKLGGYDKQGEPGEATAAMGMKGRS